ncbi:hypothetical protein [Corallibacter sp.]|uniref:hypothetical protein n=1 Tax=Corallibacter sp. TaxID=2038084 RepID=UPI003AB67364
MKNNNSASSNSDRNNSTDKGSLKYAVYDIATVKQLKKEYKESTKSYVPEKTILDEFISRYNIVGFDESQSRYIDSLQSYLNHLRPDLKLLIEYPYTDKLYRDAYYSYYSTLNRTINKNCIRISIYDYDLTLDDFTKKESREKIQEENVYLGFFVLRPTDRKRVGRSFINPKALIYPNCIITKLKSSSLIKGVSLTTEGFPHSAQDGKVHTCSETSIWSLMEYFGGKYSYYRQVLPSTILSVLKKVSYERQVPSKGLSPRQIGYTLRKFGFGSKYYSINKFKNKLPYIINDYVESGIPVLTIVRRESNNDFHAVLMIGHEKLDSNKIDYCNKPYEISINHKYKEAKISVSDSLDITTKKFIVIDDNQPPYQKSTLDKPCSYSKKMNDAKIHGCIVPLYPKIYLDIVRARQLVYELLENEIYGYRQGPDKIILRLFLTSSRSFKREIMNDEALPESYREAIVDYIMPKFIYVAEISSSELYKQNKGLGYIVLDSTSTSSDNFDNIVLFALYTDRLILRINDNSLPFVIKPKVDTIKEKLKSFNLYENNLK